MCSYTLFWCVYISKGSQFNKPMEDFPTIPAYQTDHSVALFAGSGPWWEIFSTTQMRSPICLLSTVPQEELLYPDKTVFLYSPL